MAREVKFLKETLRLKKTKKKLSPCMIKEVKNR
jgi:hypothetical protein